MLLFGFTRLVLFYLFTYILLASSVVAMNSSNQRQSYSRKEKSLGLLSSKFLISYNKPGSTVICLDDAASRLGVEKRRIYDIVNILESIGILLRKAKNEYTWKGFSAIGKTLQDLKEEGLRENNHFYGPDIDGANVRDRNFHSMKGTPTKIPCEDGDVEQNLYTVSLETGMRIVPPNLQGPCPEFSDGEEDEAACDLIRSQESTNTDSPSQVSPSRKSERPKENRKEKSLALLTRNFLKLFLCSNIRMISLEEAAKLLLGNAHATSIMKTKVRRLYDIANVLSTVNLIEKTRIAESRKPAFRWIGLEEKSTEEKQDTLSEQPTNNQDAKKSKKRSFGNDVTNIKDFKKKKHVDLFIKENSNTIEEDHSFQAKPEKSNLKQNTNESSTMSLDSFEFGPFGPEHEHKVKASENQVIDWDSLANDHRPRYLNPALKDIFSHYQHAWDMWWFSNRMKQKIFEREKRDDHK